MRYRLAYTQLPNCPDFDCDEKAIATVTAVQPGTVILYGQALGHRERFALCREHARTAVMLSNWLTPGPDVIDREGNPYVDPHSQHPGDLDPWRARQLYSYPAVNLDPGSFFRSISVH